MNNSVKLPFNVLSNFNTFSIPSLDTGNLNIEDFDHDTITNDFFPMKQATFLMFSRFTDSLFTFIQNELEQGLLECPTWSIRFRSEDVADVYRIFFSPFQHGLYNSQTGESLNQLVETINAEYKGSLSLYLESGNCEEDPEFTVFMLQLHEALSLLYYGRDIRGIGGPTA